MSLARRTPLARKSELKRGGPLRQQSEKARTTKRPTPRDTGPDEATKAALWERAGGRCELCGRDLSGGAPFSRHHRRSRGSGGSTVPWVNALSNLLLLCGSATTPGGCHERVENHAGEAYDAGWRVRRNSTYLPSELPVLIWTLTPFGSPNHALVYLDDRGHYAQGAP